MTEEKTPASSETEVFANSLSDLTNGLTFQFQHTAQLSQTDTIFLNNRWYLISNNRQLLSQTYVEHGIVQTLVDQPVDDAFRGGVDIKTEEIDTTELEEFNRYIERDGLLRAVVQACKWARLFGGGAVMLITDQDPETPFDPSALNEDTPLEFRAVDMWELYSDRVNIQGSPEVGGAAWGDTGEFYDYYGKKVHKSRVYVVHGKEPPSFVRPRLRGWGMSEVERLVRSLNQYMKNQDVIFDLLDEAKVDVYKIKGFNSSLLSKNGTQSVSNRIQSANQIKNYINALTMDIDDDYIQKQVSFTGLAEVLVQIRQGVAADLRMPMTKLFGISSAGFNSGEDDIENYNAMIESEIRTKVKFIVLDLLSVAFQKKFGTMPEDLEIKFKPLRILSAEEEEKVKDYKFKRLERMYQLGIISPEQFKESVNKDSLAPLEIEENEDTFLDEGEDENEA